MARITAAVVPLLNAADSLTTQARDLLQLHREEVARCFPEVNASLEAALDALGQAIEDLEAS